MKHTRIVIGQRVARAARNGWRSAAALALLAGLAVQPAAAQEVTGLAVGQVGGDDVSLLLLGVTVNAEGLGWKPVASLQAYRVGFDTDAADGGEIYAARPAVGLRYRMQGGFLQGDIGYAFRTEDDETDVEFFGGDESGVTTGFHGEFWGTGAYGLQGIASYNWGSDFLWSRARGTVRVLPLAGGALHLGAEAVWQGETQGDEVQVGNVLIVEEEYRAVQFGPVLQWTGQRLIVAVSGGWKEVDLNDESTWYANAELVVPLR